LGREHEGAKAVTLQEYESLLVDDSKIGTKGFFKDLKVGDHFIFLNGEECPRNVHGVHTYVVREINDKYFVFARECACQSEWTSRRNRGERLEIRFLR
jgi:hypothetical protein